MQLCVSYFQFPYCDGAHKQHNKDTGDNVGPIKIQLKESEEHKGGKKEHKGGKKDHKKNE